MVTLTTINITDTQANVTPTLTFVCVFSEALLSSSINSSTIRLYDNKIGTVVETTLTLSSNRLTIKPAKVLRENRSYTLTLVGKLTDNTTNSRYIQVSTLNYYATTTAFNFTTGSITETITTAFPPDLPDSAGFIGTTLYEDLPTDLDIDYISPSPLSYAIPRTTSLITFKFSESVPAQDDNITIVVKPLLNNVDYLAIDNDASDGYIYHYNDRQGTSYDWTLPTAITEWNGQYLYIHLSSDAGLISSSNKMPYGTVVVVNFEATLSSDTDKYLSTAQEYEFIFEAAPVFGTVDAVMFDPIFSTLPAVPNKLVYKLLIKYSNDLSRRRTSMTKCGFTLSAQDYVEANSTLYLLQKALMAIHIYGRKRRETLGDLTIEYSEREFLNSIDGMTYAKELKDRITRASKNMSTGIAVTTILRQGSSTYCYLYTRQPRASDYRAGQDVSTMSNYANESNYNSWPFLAPNDLGR